MHQSHIKKTNPIVDHTWHWTPKLILVHLVVLCHLVMCLLGYASHDCDGSPRVATKDYDGFIGLAYKDCEINELNSSKDDIIKSRLVEQQPSNCLRNLKLQLCHKLIRLLMLRAHQRWTLLSNLKTTRHCQMVIQHIGYS
jgi:hypothetical protein